MAYYPKAFEEYYTRADHWLGYNTPAWLQEKVKRIACNSWKAGRKHGQSEERKP